MKNKTGLSSAKWQSTMAKSGMGAQGMGSNGATGMLSYGAGLMGKAKIASMMKSYAMQKSETDGDSQMSLSQIRSMAHHIDEILTSTDFKTDHPDWVDAKITLAADYLATVAHYLEGDQDLAKSCESVRAKMNDMGGRKNLQSTK